MPSVNSDDGSLFKKVSLEFTVLAERMWKPRFKIIRSPSHDFFDDGLYHRKFLPIRPIWKSFSVETTECVQLFADKMDPGHVRCTGCDQEIICVARCI